ncbi:MAG: DUF2490 domain-containing protein [Deltaproteobacteria bacterium]|nr:DUF2490 domain-containing protein [Deltaproteobacteria bacterium]
MKLIPPLLVALSTLAMAPSTAAAQGRSQFEVWFGLPMTVDLGEDVPRVQIWFDNHVRRQPGQTQLLVRPGIGLKIYEWMTVYAGYAWTPTFVDEPQEVQNQHRIWEQLILDLDPHRRLAFQSRTRFEQRFREGSDDVSLRLRQLARFDWELAPDSPFGITVWDELSLWLSDTDWGPTIGLDQNRIFLGPTVKVPALGHFEAGYLFVYRRRSTDVYAHVVLTQFIVSL